MSVLCLYVCMNVLCLYVCSLSVCVYVCFRQFVCMCVSVSLYVCVRILFLRCILNVLYTLVETMRTFNGGSPEQKGSPMDTMAESFRSDFIGKHVRLPSILLTAGIQMW